MRHTLIARLGPLTLVLLLACDAVRSDVPPAPNPSIAAQLSSAGWSEWSEPVNLGAPVNSAFTEQNSALSKDGLTLYIQSNRPGGFGGNDLWVSHRASLDSPWEEPVNLGNVVNTPGAEGGPWLSNDDMTAPAELNTAVNVGGTTHAVELARTLEAQHLHHVSSIAVAGEYRGTFEESMFDEGQKLPSPYHRTKFESERIVREQPYVPWRAYRPAIVVGDSQTGEMDKIDGPYYFFKAIQRMRRLLPEWLPLVGVDVGNTNVVPVDWVVAAVCSFPRVAASMTRGGRP